MQLKIIDIHSYEMGFILKKLNLENLIKPSNSTKNRTPLTVRRQLSQILVQFMLPEVNDIEIKRHDSGLPYLFSSHVKIPLPSISISHSGSWVGIVLSNSSNYIAIDLEDMDSNRSYLAIAESFFSLSENQLIKIEGKIGFYKLWTAKEAIAKCLGQDITQALQLDLGKTLLNCPLNTQFKIEILDKNYELHQNIINGHIFYTTCFQSS